MAEAAFSEDGKYYSSISGDGRLKIWDTELNTLTQEYTPDLHLASPLTCLQWISVAQNTGQKQKKGKNRNSISESESQCIALGTTKGNVLVYSVAQAKIQVILKPAKIGKIGALDWHRNYGLYSCYERNSLVVEWDLEKASVRNSYSVAIDSNSKQGNIISAIKIIPHNLETGACYIVTASWQVRLWRLHGKEASVLKTLGHNASQSAVLSVATFKNQCWLIEGSQNERLLSFWNVTITDDLQPQVNGDQSPSKKKRKSISEDVKLEITVVTNASYNFVLEDAPKTVGVDLKEQDGAVRLNLVAATRSGVVHYYGHMLNGSSIKPLKPSVTLQATTPEAAPIPLQCCRVKPSGDLLLGYPCGPLMIFETVTPDLKTKNQILIRGESKPSKKARNNQQEINKVRADARSAAAAVLEPLGGVARKRAAAGGQVEVPMEARLANLSLDIGERGKGAVNQNLTKLLIQGLQSRDWSILNLVLHNKDASVASRTVGALPAEFVPALIERLVEMATRGTSRCAEVCTWVHAITVRHAALVLAMSPPHSDNLARLLAIFAHRRSYMCQLMNLKGRVELTIKQRTDSKELEQQKPLLEYRDDTSSDEEMQVEHKTDSEQSWGDQQFDSDRGEEEPDSSDSDE